MIFEEEYLNYEKMEKEQNMILGKIGMVIY